MTTHPAGRAATYIAWLVTAASILALLGAAAYAMRLQIRVADLETRLRQTLVRVSIADRAMADARRVAADAQASVAVLASPDVARVELTGQPAAPGASGRAYWSRARGLVLVASNLPTPPDGKVYQVWIITVHAPNIAGPMTIDATGASTTFFPTASDIGAPAEVVVTMEPRGDVTRPTGPRFLAGGPFKDRL